MQRPFRFTDGLTLGDAVRQKLRDQVVGECSVAAFTAKALLTALKQSEK